MLSPVYFGLRGMILIMLIVLAVSCRPAAEAHQRWIANYGVCPKGAPAPNQSFEPTPN